jgi:hypothetical protein
MVLPIPREAESAFACHCKGQAGLRYVYMLAAAMYQCSLRQLLVTGALSRSLYLTQRGKGVMCQPAAVETHGTQTITIGQ